MSKVRRVENSWWAIRDAEYCSTGLGDKFFSIKDARDYIDASNKRHVALGYKAKTYLIVHHEWLRCFNDDNIMTREEELTLSIELYGNGVKKPLVEGDYG